MLRKWKYHEKIDSRKFRRASPILAESILSQDTEASNWRQVSRWCEKFRWDKRLHILDPSRWQLPLCRTDRIYSLMRLAGHLIELSREFLLVRAVHLHIQLEEDLKMKGRLRITKWSSQSIRQPFSGSVSGGKGVTICLDGILTVDAPSEPAFPFPVNLSVAKLLRNLKFASKLSITISFHSRMIWNYLVLTCYDF